MTKEHKAFLKNECVSDQLLIFWRDCSDCARITVQYVLSCDQLKMNRFEHPQHSRNCAKYKSQGTTIYAITTNWKFACSAGL